MSYENQGEKQKKCFCVHYETCSLELYVSTLLRSIYIPRNVRNIKVYRFLEIYNLLSLRQALEKLNNILYTFEKIYFGIYCQKLEK